MGLELDFTILHYLLRDKQFALQISKEINTEYFDPKLQVFYSVIAEHFADPHVREVLSLGALLDHLNRRAMADQQERFRVIYNKAKALRVNGEPLEPEDFKYYLKRFKDRRNIEIARVNTEALAGILKDRPNAEEVNKILHETMRDIAAVNQIQVFDEGTVGTDVRNMLLEYQAITEDPSPFRGVLVGYHDLDKRTNGFQGGELIVVCGLDGSGKSMLMMNMGINAHLGTNNIETSLDDLADNGNNILYFTLEMPRSNKGEFTQASYLNKRVLAAVAEVELSALRSGTLDVRDQAKLEQTVEWLEAYENHKKFHVVDIPRGAKVADIEAKYLEVRETMEVDLIIVDYMGIMAPDTSDIPDHQGQGAIAAGLHEFARLYNVPCLTAAQLNRPSGSNSQSLNSQKFNSTRVARSSGIPQNCNMLFIIQTRDDEEEQDDMRITLSKMRDGPKGEVILTKGFSKMKIYDGEPYAADDEEISDFVDPIITNGVPPNVPQV